MRTLLVLFVSVLSSTVLASLFQNSTVDRFPCVNFRLREVPVIPKATEDGQYYLDAHVHDRLRFIFSPKCDFKITCISYNPATKHSKSLTEAGNNIDYYLEDGSRGMVRCARANSTGDLFAFHLFVQNNQKQFFTDMSIRNLGDDGLQIACFGGFYTKAVRLKVNGKYLDVPYNPLKGFHIKKENDTLNKFYQCEKDKELKSLTYHPINPTLLRFRDRFIMTKQYYFFRTEIKCIIEDDPSIPFEEYSVILSCPNSTTCPLLTRLQSSNKKRVFAGSLDKNQKITESDYYCVFLKDQEVIAHAFLTESEDHTSTIAIAIIVIAIVVIGVLILKKLGKLHYKKLKTSDTMHFGTAELLFENSEQIGSGNSSVIHVTKVKNSGTQVVVKYSNKTSQFAKEFKILKSIRHVNIISALGTAVLPIQRSCYVLKVEHLVLPYYPQKSLNEYIARFSPAIKIEDGNMPVFYSSDNKERLTLFDMYSLAWQIALALQYLKSRGITHRDVAMRNVLVSHNNIIKLIDFERAEKGETKKVSLKQKALRQFRRSEKIPFTIYPIEAINGYYFYSTEVFSFGNILLEMFNFGNLAPISNEAYLLRLKQKPIQPPNAPTLIYELICDCMQYDYRHRPNIDNCEGILRTATQSLSEIKYFNLKKQFIEEDARNIFDGIDDGYREVPIEDL